MRNLSKIQRRAWLRLSRTDNVDPVTFQNQNARFCTASAALEELPRIVSGGRNRSGDRNFELPG